MFVPKERARAVRRRAKVPPDDVAREGERARLGRNRRRLAFGFSRCDWGGADRSERGARAPQAIRSLLPQGDELPASPQVVRGCAAELSRSAASTGGVWDVLSLREERRAVRIDAGAFSADERRAYLYDAVSVRGRVQCGERNVSELFQAFRDREISDAFLDA